MLTPYKRADVEFEWISDLEEQGCFSKVYLAHDRHLAHDLVIKEIRKKETLTTTTTLMKQGFSINMHIQILCKFSMLLNVRAISI